MKILIIGAGVAGTSCAIKLLKSGFDVTLIDITTFPRFRPGESCHPGIEPLLQQLDVWQDILSLNPIRYNSTNVNYEGKDSEVFFNEAENWQGFQFPRENFDSILLNKAISMGAKFHPQTKTLNIVSEENMVLSIVTDKGEFKFDFLIDATGSKSITSSKLRLLKEKYSKPIVSNYTQLFTTENLSSKLKSYFEITSEYWGYISLIKPNTYSITYSCSHSLAEMNKNLFIIKHFCKPYTILISKGFETSWSLTTNNKFENLYLVGDALMTFDPTSSKGILKSIMTGIYAAHILENVKEKKITKTQGVKTYQKWSKDFFENELTRIKELLPVTMVQNVFN